MDVCRHNLAWSQPRIEKTGLAWPCRNHFDSSRSACFAATADRKSALCSRCPTLLDFVSRVPSPRSWPQFAMTTTNLLLKSSTVSHSCCSMGNNLGQGVVESIPSPGCVTSLCHLSQSRTCRRRVHAGISLTSGPFSPPPRSPVCGVQFRIYLFSGYT